MKGKVNSFRASNRGMGPCPLGRGIPYFCRMNTRIEQLLRFLETSPDDPFLYHALALEYIKEGEKEKAEFQFLHNLREHPEYLPTYYHLAVFYLDKGEEDQANPLLQKGMELARAGGDDHSYRELKSLWEENYL